MAGKEIVYTFSVYTKDILFKDYYFRVYTYKPLKTQFSNINYGYYPS